MENQAESPHPFHYSMDKTVLQKILDWTVPIGVFLLYFFLYNFGKITPSEMIKNAGLSAIALLSITLFIGSASRFVPAFNVFKAHRKFWGIASVVFILIHTLLVIIFDLKLHIFDVFNTSDPDFFGFMAGLVALLILVVVVVSSFHFVITRLHPGIWKKLQTTSYLALTLAVAHFYLMEQQGGVLVIKRLLGTLTFWFATVVIILRIIVLIFPKKEQELLHPPLSA